MEWWASAGGRYDTFLLFNFSLKLANLLPLNLSSFCNPSAWTTLQIEQIARYDGLILSKTFIWHGKPRKDILNPGRFVLICVIRSSIVLQWLFILEGLPTLMLGLWIRRSLAESPLKAKFLREDEAEWLHERQTTGRNMKMDATEPRAWHAVNSWKTWWELILLLQARFRSTDDCIASVRHESFGCKRKNLSGLVNVSGTKDFSKEQTQHLHFWPA